MDITTFRTAFPEFASATAYPDAMVTFWSGLAEKHISETRWSDLYSYGVQLAAAHYLVLAKEDSTAGAAGGVPGKASGVVSSKSAGPVSVSYDTSNFTEKDAGHWNRTRYGTQYIKLARMFGMGGVQL